jgi:hypothetical protein
VLLPVAAVLAIGFAVKLKPPLDGSEWWRRARAWAETHLHLGRIVRRRLPGSEHGVVEGDEPRGPIARS